MASSSLLAAAAAMSIREGGDNFEAKPSTKQKLTQIVEGFATFDVEMKMGTKQRKELEEHRISEIKQETMRLDSELSSEIKKRTEMNRSLQAFFDQSLAQTADRLRTMMDDRTTRLNSRLDDLQQQIDDLSSSFARQKEEVLRHVEQRGEELATMLNEFKEATEKDRASRLQREASIVKQLTDHEHEVAKTFGDATTARERRYAKIKKLLEDNIRLRSKAEERFELMMEQDLNALKNQLRLERETREREDDDIVEALNRYTTKLQASLKILNSTDM